MAAVHTLVFKKAIRIHIYIRKNNYLYKLYKKKVVKLWRTYFTLRRLLKYLIYIDKNIKNILLS